jgi:DNA-binding NarL/FixJ family response regulator
MGVFEKGVNSCPKVIIADDHRDVHLVLATILGSSVEIIRHVFDGLQLIEACERLSPDLLIVDVNMPVLDGVEAVKFLERTVGVSAQSFRVVFLSSAGDRWTMHRIRSTTAPGFVQKARLAEDLLPAIQTVMNGESFFPPNQP